MANSVALKHPTIPHLVYYVRADALPTEGAGESARPPDKKPRLIAFTKPAGPPRLVAFTRTGATRPNPHEDLPESRWMPIPAEKPELLKPIPDEESWPKRGVQYPDWYHGFLPRYDSYIRVDKVSDNRNIKCRMVFGPDRFGHVAKTRYFHFDGCGHSREFIHVKFMERAGRKLENYKPVPAKQHFAEIWPDTLDTDILDHVSIEVEDSHRVTLTHVEFVLNGLVILDTDYQHTFSGSYSLETDIREFRRQYLNNTKNPILRLAAGQIGKSWNPAWYNAAEGENYWSDGWCKDFVKWVLRNGTILRPPEWTGNLGRYFMGFCSDSDLEWHTLYLAPNRKFDFRNDEYSEKSDYYDHVMEDHHKANPQFCRWSELASRVKPGFVIQMHKGHHVGFFIDWEHWHNRWIKGFDRSLQINYARTIEGNREDRVQLGRRQIGDEHSNADNVDVFWKASRHSQNGYGHQDGFGITDFLPPPAPKTKPKLEGGGH